MLWGVDAEERDRKARFAYSLRRAREKRELTPPQLAALVGVTRGTVNNWENRSIKDAPSILLLGTLSKALGVDPRLFAVLPEEPPSDVDAFLVEEAVGRGVEEGLARGARPPAKPGGRGKPSPPRPRLRAVDGPGPDQPKDSEP